MKFKRIVLTFTVVLTMMVFSAPQAADYKIGFVETARLLSQSPQVTAVRDKLKKEFSRRDTELVSQTKQIKTLKDQLTRDGAVMSESEAKRLEKDILTRSRKLKNAQSDFQADLNLRQNEEMQKIRKQLREVIQSVAKDNEFDLVLESGVVHSSKRANITDMVLERLKKEFKGK